MFFFKKSLLLVLLLLLIPFSSFAYYDLGKPTGFVNDYAGLLTSEQKQTLENKLTQFEKESSNEISVVSISSLKGDYIENFAVKLFESWKIGKDKKDNGILVLIAKDDRQMRIEVGYGLEGAMTDSQSFWIINQVMKPAFRQNDFYMGIDGAVDKIIAAAKGEYLPEDTGSESGGSSGFENFIVFGFILFMWLAAILGRSKSWWAGGVIGGIIGVIIGIVKGLLVFGIISIIVLIPLGLLFDFIVSRQYESGKARGHIPWWVGGGRGGSGSGGGGFGGFGGGSSGGGGASGSW